jgi:hypothetical protein
MTTITRTYGPLTAVFSDEGQVSPNESDDVEVNCQLRLPKEQFGLREDLKFGGRVTLAGLPLHYDWGATTGDYRYIDCSFSAPTYQQAVTKADKWVKDEAEKLLTAIDARERSLALAGLFEDVVI